MNYFRKHPYQRKSLLAKLFQFFWWPVAFSFGLIRQLIFQFLWLSGLINRSLAAVGVQLRIWLTTREYRFLLKGLPAILLVISVLYIMVISISNSKELIVDGYLEQAKRALDANDSQQASMLYERVIQIQGPSDPTLYQLALSLGKEGQFERANYILDYLAPEKDPRYGPAHFLKAKSILAAPEKLDPIRFLQAKRQLQNAYSANRFDNDVCFTLAEIYFGEGDIPNAQKYYAEIEKDFAPARLQLAKTYSLTGNHEKAKELALSAKRELEQLGVLSQNDTRYVLIYADILTFLEEYQAAITQVSRLYLLDPKPELRDALVQIKVNWADSLLIKNPQDLRPCFLILADVLKFHSENLLVFDRLMKILGHKDQISNEAREMLMDCVTRGTELAMSHTLLGTDAGDRGDYEKSIFHLNRALEISPKSTIIINNLAWYLAIKTDPELNRAFELIDTLINQSKNPIPQLFDTRGMINLKLGKFNSALIDLERALRDLENDPGIHERLSEVYDKLGDKELSAKHKNRETELRKAKK